MFPHFRVILWAKTQHQNFKIKTTISDGVNHANSENPSFDLIRCKMTDW